MNYFLEPILIRICFLLYMLMNIILLTVLESEVREGRGCVEMFVFMRRVRQREIRIYTYKHSSVSISALLRIQLISSSCCCGERVECCVRACSCV